MSLEEDIKQDKFQSEHQKASINILYTGSWLYNVNATYLKKFGITFANGPDLATHISQYFRIKGVPETYFVDKEGVLQFVQVGPFTSIDQIRAQIDPLLK